ncbi:protein LNK3 isoform X2 [Carica papaya]|uniref:protein LNK3 isoform X2 n=1 Tax=Carica papaya TaxID=3649 RepID=UPI000B8CA438|nr:protein LNK3 isoform X2 [Carica papaya]
MDWIIGSCNDDLMVPMDDELSDMLMSDESWSMWGPTAPEGFELPQKYFMMDQHPNSSLNYRGFSNEFEMKSIQVPGDDCRRSLSARDLHDQQNYQLDGFSRIEEMDEIFLNSLLEDHPGNEDLHEPFCFSSESQSGTISAVGWEKDEVSAPLFIPCNSEPEDPVKALSVKVYAHHDESSSNVHVAKQASLEESVMQDLERVMAQLTNKTRICFRDSFYRLAQNSEQQSVSHTQYASVSTNTPRLCTSKDEKIRSGRKKAVESETNSIDRAIANLAFNKMDSNARSFQTTSRNSNQEMTRGTRLHDYH